MKIKIQTGSLNQKQVDNLIEDKNTINLSNRMSTKQMEQKRAIRKEKLLFKKYWKEILTLAILFIGVLIAIIQLLGNNVTYANENTPDPYFIPMESVVDREAFCENLSFTDYERYIKDCKEIITIDNVNEKAFDFIIQFEGFHDKPYWDHKQWSCGYGMRCNKNTTGITKEKSKEFVIERIKNIRERYKLYKYDDNMEVALISFTYNTGSMPEGYQWYIKHNYINALKNRMRQYVYASGQKLRGLETRREAEVSLF